MDGIEPRLVGTKNFFRRGIRIPRRQGPIGVQGRGLRPERIMSEAGVPSAAGGDVDSEIGGNRTRRRIAVGAPVRIRRRMIAMAALLSIPGTMTGAVSYGIPPRGFERRPIRGPGWIRAETASGRAAPRGLISFGDEENDSRYKPKKILIPTRKEKPLMLISAGRMFLRRGSASGSSSKNSTRQ